MSSKSESPRSKVHPREAAIRPSDLLTFRPSTAFATFVAICTTILAIAWLQQPQTSGELVGHAAKLRYFFDLILTDARLPAWLPGYLTGSPSATLLSFALAFPVYLPGILLAGPVVGMKITALLLLAAGGFAAFLLGRRLSGNGWTGFAVGAAYLLAPQLLLRLGWQEHMTIVVCYPLVPLCFWALLRIADRGTPVDSILFATLFSATLLAWSKMGATLVVPIAIFSLWLFATRPADRARLLRAFLWVLPAVTVMGVLALLPLVRERAFMTVFELQPFDAWQAQYSVKTATSWFDRGGWLFRSLPPTIGIDRGAYYLGLLGIVAVAIHIGLHWRTTGHNSPATPHTSAEALRPFLAIFLAAFWLSFGPSSVWSANSAFLASALRLDDLVIPLHWLAFAAPAIAIWWLCRHAFQHPYLPFATFALVYYFVPGFRILEFLPVYQDLRAPDSFFILNATLAWSVCSGIAVTGLLRRIDRPALQTAAAVAALAIAVTDSSVYARWFFRSDLTPSTISNYAATAVKLSEGTGRVYPLSGRYFTLDLPITAGRPVAVEALNRYLMPLHASRLQVASRFSAPALLAYLRLAGISDVLLDKSDASLPADFQAWIRTLLPVTYENPDFAILHHPDHLFPAFAATQTTTAPPDLEETTEALTQSQSDTLTIAPGSGDFEPSDPSADEGAPPFLPLAATAPDADTREIDLRGESEWIVLNEAWHPDWRATVDGRPTPIHRAASALPSVRVTPADQAATFTFRPPAWYPITLATSAVGWLAAILFLSFAPNRWRTPARNPPIPPDRSAIARPLALLPTYNEAANVPSILTEILAADPRLDILVIDDASPDGTADLVRAHAAFGTRIQLLDRPTKLGLGSAYRAGFRWAIAHDHDACLEIDADHSHDPADIPRLLAALDDGTDLAVGSRYLDGTRVVNWPRHRLALSTFATHYTRTLTGLPLTDATSGFKAIRTTALEAIPRDTLCADGYGFQIELHWVLWKTGHRIREIPITFTERRSGQTKMTLSIAVEAALLLLRLAIAQHRHSET